MASFEELGLPEASLAAAKRMGYTMPTPVQERAIPIVLAGRDVIAAAQTGTGKTAAFTLPLMGTLAHAEQGSGPLMLVITPTRELAQQIGEVADQVAVSTHHRIAVVVGGLSYKPQIEKLRRGVDVLIATPGRLIDLMDQKAVCLSNIEALVLDEADRMLDMGFLPAVKRIVAETPKARQTLLFSATIDGSIKSITGSMLRDPETVEIARKGDVAETVEQYVIHAPQSVKPALIKAVLAEKGAERVIVFARTRSRADSTCRRLRKAGYAAEAIHSDRSQNQRRRALASFAEGKVNIITATDVLARGIDVDEVDYVINYDAPEQAEDYVHRSGRTGRAGKCGFAVTFVTPENEGELRAIQKLVKKTIPEMKLEHFDIAEAEAAAAEASITAQSKRDPEVNKIKRQLAGKAREKAGAAAVRSASEEGVRERKGPQRKRAANKASGTGKTTSEKPKNTKVKGRKPSNAQLPKKSAKLAKQGGPTRPAKDAKRTKKQVEARDCKPGRSRRAEVARSRTASSKRR